jgi:(1->4)-alpha-D-glucan 1-alpha-D-glucosylmutase
MRVPGATYRLQLNDSFTLDDARAVTPYLARLGITDLYLSPIFEAMPGSTHGYDVTDPTRVRASIGGEPALIELADEVQRLDMGILLDIVPNHMAASVHNVWWRDVLEKGRRSQYAHFFDIDWGAGDRPGRVRLPLLGDDLSAIIQRDEIDIDCDAHEVVYFETRLPLATGSVAADAATLAGPGRRDAVLRILERQHYELVYWRTASINMNYRRFFDITDLAGVRVEESDVFNATHSLIRGLAAAGVITGLRIDHVDGLRDPTAYLRRLRERVRGPGGEPVYTVVEKILERTERLPAEWACEGTTGYEFLGLATGVLIDSDGYDQLEAAYGRMTGSIHPFAALVRDKKLLVMDRLFGGELSALARSLSALTRLSESAARAAIAEITASMRVYRTYTRSRAVRVEDRAHIEAAARDAAERRPDLATDLRRLCRVALLEDAPVAENTLDWIMRWQQFTGPVMAKGFEDTALYCHNVLLAANDVGTDPAAPAISVAALHRALAKRQLHSPRSLNATATHDTKRGEDTRARIAVLSEVTDEWRRSLRRWIREGDAWKVELVDDDDGAVVPDADVDSLLYQTLVGAWPTGGADEVFTERIKAYMTKAVREAKEQTSWRRPDEDYEQAITTFIDRLMQEFGREGLADDIANFSSTITPHGLLNAITQSLLKITAPGIPDVYQGTELWSFTLVDPDNRQPVDFVQRRRVLDDVAAFIDQPDPAILQDALRSWQDGRVKLLLIAQALHCRAQHPDLFQRGDYLPLAAEGAHANSVIAFARSLADQDCIVVLPRLTGRVAGAGSLPAPDDWHDTRLRLPAPLRRRWQNRFTGATVTTGEVVSVATLFDAVPFALLGGLAPDSRHG